MANWTKLSDGTWGIKSTTGRTGQTVKVTRANGTSSTVTLGALVKRTRWGTVFTVAGKAAPATTRRTRRTRTRRTRRNPGQSNGAGIQATLRAEVAATKAKAIAKAFSVSRQEPVDPSVARFRLLDLSDEPTSPAPAVDEGPGRQLQID